MVFSRWFAPEATLLVNGSNRYSMSTMATPGANKSGGVD
jgi:hypothetical protein